MSDLAAFPIEPLRDREENPPAGERKDRKPRPPAREKAFSEEAVPLETIEAAEPHELDEMA